MDNWIFLFLGLILAYFLEFTRPFVKSLYERRVYASKEARLKALVNEYYLKRYYKDNLTEFAVKLVRDVAVGLSMLTLTVLQVGIFILRGDESEIDRSISLALTVAFAGATFLQFNRVVNYYTDVIPFDEFE